jgi:hypothetical protein
MSSPIHRRRPEYVAEGYTCGPYRATAVRFDVETHNRIRDMAIKNNISFAEQIRMLVEWGFEAEQ